MKKASYLLFLLTGLFLYKNIYAQQDFTLYNMNLVPQRNYINPAFVPGEGKMFIGIPALSSQYINVTNNGFKYSDAVKHRFDDSLYIDFDNVLSKLSKDNYLSSNYRMDILSFGIAVKKNYFSFNVTEKVDFRFRYPKNFMEFVWKGNGAYLDKQVNFNFGFNFTHYREYSLGAARQITDKLSVGLKLKYLYGMENFNTKKTDISLMTDADDFAITAKANIELNSSGLKDDTGENFNVTDYAFKRGNNGFGADFGLEYKATEQFTVSGSIVDLGVINWKYNTNNYISHDQNAHFTYNGFELNQLINSDSASTKDIGKALGDSLAEIFKIDTLHKSYKTRLSPQIYIGGTLAFSESSNAGVLVYWQAFDKKIHPGIAFSYNHRVADWLNLSASYSMYNRSFTNLGLGAAIKGGPVQFYIVTDNILGMIFPQNAKNIQLHFGINFILGKKAAVPPPAAASPASAPATPSAGGK